MKKMIMIAATAVGIFSSATFAQSADDGQSSIVQNASLESIQISDDAGQTPDEKTVTCFFIFKDKPSNYFYSFDRKEKKLTFEFNDVAPGDGDIPSLADAPIKGFRIEKDKVDANKDVQGLNPEWHDLVKVSFFLDALPIIAVKDEYSVISYSFKWSSDPEKQKALVQKDDSITRRNVTIGFVVGGVAAAAGAIAIFANGQKPKDKPPVPDVSMDGLPNHGTLPSQ